MNYQWIKTSIGEIADIKHGWAFPGSGISEEVSDNVLVTPGSFKIGGGFKKDNKKFFNGDYPHEYLLHPDDLIVTMTDLSKNTDTLGFSALVPDDGKKYLHNQRIGLVQLKSNVIDKKYLYWLLRTYHYQRFIAGSASGTTVKHTSPTLIKKYCFLMPPLEKQKKIVGVLSSLDNKIELNAQINHNLVEQAKAIFKSWFVDFEPFGNCSPDNWKSGLLGDFVEIKRGGSPRPIQNYLSDRGLRWLKISDATACSSPFIIDIKEHIEESGLSKTVLLHAGALVLSNSATPGIPKILDVDSCIHDGWLYFPKSRLSNEFLFLFFKHIRPNLVSLGNGSVFTNLKTDILKAYPFILPDEEILNSFNDIVVPVFEKIKNNSREINGLAQLRDALLPKLMSGEIDVSEVEV